jgi:hypothetical protein
MRIEKDIPFGDHLTFDAYHPEEDAARVVLIVSGYPDDGFQRITGSRFKELPSNVAWCERFANAGMLAVAYTNVDPVSGAAAIVDHIRTTWPSHSIALWACSGNVPVALWLLMEHGPFARAALLYGYTLDVDDAATKFRFANPASGHSAGDLPRETPILFVRAGADAMPDLNAAADRFVANALAADLPLTAVNVPAAPHAFDVTSDDEATLRAIANVVAFLGG